MCVCGGGEKWLSTCRYIWKHSKNLIKMKTFYNIKCKVYSHEKLNTSKGVIRNKELSLAIRAQSAGAVEYTGSLQRSKTPPNECSRYDIKQSDSEVPVILELWGMWSTPSLPLLPGPLSPGVVAPDKGPVYGLNRNKPWFELTVFCI